MRIYFVQWLDVANAKQVTNESTSSLLNQTKKQPVQTQAQPVPQYQQPAPVSNAANTATIKDTEMNNNDLVPVPSQVENYKLMEKKFTKAFTPPRSAGAESELDSNVQRSTRGRFNSVNETLVSTGTLLHHTSAAASPATNALSITTNASAQANISNTITPNEFFPLSSSPPAFKFQIASSPSNKFFLDHRQSLLTTNNFGADQMLIDELEEETILDVIKKKFYHIFNLTSNY